MMCLRYSICLLMLIKVVLQDELPECVTEVTTCPDTAIKWNCRENEKKCRDSKEIYTCMMFQNISLVEMCMSDFVIPNGTDGCPFIIGCQEGKPIASGNNNNCTDEKVGCPSKYHGGYPVSRLFIFPKCLKGEIVRTPIPSATTSPTTVTPIKTASSLNTDGEIKTVVISVASALFCCLLIYVFSKKLLSFSQRGSPPDEYHENVPFLRNQNSSENIDSEFSKNPDGLHPITNALINNEKKEFLKLYSDLVAISDLNERRNAIDHIKGDILMLVEKYSSLKGHEMSLRYDARRKTVTILVLSDEVKKPSFHRIFNFDVKIKYHKMIFESKPGENLKERRPKDGYSTENSTTDQLKNADELIKKHSAKWWHIHSNLVAITAEVTGSKKDDIEIILICCGKGLIPFGEDKFPKFVKLEEKKIPISVREGYFNFTGKAGKPTGYIEELCMGCQIGPWNSDKTGSLGLFIDVKGYLKCITTCHSIYSSSELHKVVNKKAVLQPGPSDIHCEHTRVKQIFGKVERKAFRMCNENGKEIGVDAVLVSIQTRHPKDGRLAIKDKRQLDNAGYSFQDIPVYETGKYVNDIYEFEKCRTVIKSGSATGLTSGHICMTGTEIRLSGEYASSAQQKQIMKGQLEIRGNKDVFSQDGDSGAAVFLRTGSTDLHCLGLVIGNIFTMESGWTTVVTPISAVLEVLKLNYNNIKRFDEKKGGDLQQEK